MALEMDDFAQTPFGDQPPQGEEIGVPAAVLKGRQHLAARARGLRHGAGIGRAGGKGLVDHHMLARMERGDGVFGMKLVRAGDDDQIDIRPFEQRGNIGHHGHPRQARMDLGRIA